MSGKANFLRPLIHNKTLEDCPAESLADPGQRRHCQRSVKPTGGFPKLAAAKPDGFEGFAAAAAPQNKLPDD